MALRGRAAQSEARALAHRPLWIAMAQVAVLYAGSTLLTLLYRLYREAFGFSQLTLTLIYAAYVLGNLTALLLLGRHSIRSGAARPTSPRQRSPPARHWSLSSRRRPRGCSPAVS
jgi:predicted MFS family arabinose efflux permease